MSKKRTVISLILRQQLWLLWKEQGGEKIAVTSGLKRLFQLRSGNIVEWTEIWVGLVRVFVLFLQPLSWSSGSGRLIEEAVAEVYISYQFRAQTCSGPQRAKERKKMCVLWMRTKYELGEWEETDFNSNVHFKNLISKTVFEGQG